MAILLATSALYSQGASQSRHLTLQQIAAIRGGANQWTSIVIIRGGRLISVASKAFKSDAPTVILESNDLIAFNEAADSLQEWSAAHPDRAISLAEIEGLSAGAVVRVDGSLVKPAAEKKVQLRVPTKSGESSQSVASSVLPMANQSESVQASPTLAYPKTIGSTPPSPSKEPKSSTPWSEVAVLIVAAIGLLWLVLKGRK